MGADVYVTKPFSTRDLMARIEALLEPPDLPAIRQRRDPCRRGRPSPLAMLRCSTRTAGAV